MRIRRLDKPSLALVVTLVLALALLAALRLPHLSLLHPQDSYVANFANAGGLTEGAEVRVGGVAVGEVDNVSLDGRQVRVEFSVTHGLRLGDESRASIEIATVLGNVFLQVSSQGTGELRAETPIPVSRTSVPFTLLDALGTASQKTSAIDQRALRTSLQQISGTLAGISKRDVDQTVRGLGALTRALGSRQDEIAALISGAREITDDLVAKRGAIVQLIGQSDVFLRMLNSRHTAIRRLLVHTRDLAAEVSVLIERDGAPLTSALTRINRLATMFARDARTIRRSVDVLGKFSVNIANATGNGPWLDVYLPTGLIPDNVIAGCGTSPEPGCGNR